MVLIRFAKQNSPYWCRSYAFEYRNPCIFVHYNVLPWHSACCTMYSSPGLDAGSWGWFGRSADWVDAVRLVKSIPSKVLFPCKKYPLAFAVGSLGNSNVSTNGRDFPLYLVVFLTFIVPSSRSLTSTVVFSSLRFWGLHKMKRGGENKVRRILHQWYHTWWSGRC